MTQRQPKTRDSAGRAGLNDVADTRRVRTASSTRAEVERTAGSASERRSEVRSSSATGRTVQTRQSSAQGRTGQERRSTAERSSQTRSSGNRNVSGGSGRVYRPTNNGAQRAKRKNRKKKKSPIGLIIVAAVVIIAIVVGIIAFANRGSGGGGEQPVTEAEQKQTLPRPAIEGTATIGVTGDILIHDSVRNAAWNGEDYDFTTSFSAVKSYWSEVDYMIANLEVTLGGYEPYTGYPGFNAPDTIIDGLKDAGVDMLLTANNHSYDTGEDGFLRTQEVITEKGLDYIGTRLTEDDSYLLVKDINGIRFGMICYTYDTSDATGYMSLNGITMSDTAANLVNSFNYEDLDSLYSRLETELANMDAQDCDVKVLFIHWGQEYQDDPNGYQTEMAQKFADMGVDIIVGGHPHVIQRFDTLTGSSGNTTYCLYSMGNTLSSQRKEVMDPEEPRGYTEDGLTFEFTFIKFNNGTVKLNDIYILPTWVEVNSAFEVIPLDYKLSASDWAAYSTWEATESYNRTLGRLGEVYPAVREALGKEAVPESIE